MPSASAWLKWALLAAAALSPSVSLAWVGGLDLGPRPTTGEQAVAGQEARNASIVRALACDDELDFMGRFATGRSIGKEWPTAHMMAKARFVARSGAIRLDGCIAAAPTPDMARWRSVFASEEPRAKISLRDPTTFDGMLLWNEASVDGTTGDAQVAALAGAVSKLYFERFGEDCKDVVSAEQDRLRFWLTNACLMRQVAVVLTHPNLGAWEGAGDSKTFMLPGTDGIPCLTALPDLPMEDTKGDWDMGVIAYSRLAHLIYTAKSVKPEVAPNADLALAKLRKWLLTLAGPPAQESYDLVWGCGNFANSYGSAEDYVQDNDVHNDALNKDVGGENDSDPSFWESLWRFLRFLLVVAAIAAAIGLALGALAGTALASAAGATAAAAGAAVAIAVLGTALVGWLPETENHLFMQNSSKYIENKLMMAELRDIGNQEGFDRIAQENEEVRVWLLERMQRVVEDDFDEYNSKPYSRYTHQALLNLLDYACEVSWTWDKASWPPQSPPTCEAKDQSLVTGAAAVYDLSIAKLAVGSHEGRRAPPYRRLVDTNFKYQSSWNDANAKNNPQRPLRFHDLGTGSDYLLAALQAWTASTQHAEAGRANPGSIHHMMWFATSRYVPNALILDLAVDKSTPLEQTITHDGDEYYSSGPAWLLTAGGDDVEPAEQLQVNVHLLCFTGLDLPLCRFGNTNDRGVGVPTTLMVHGPMGRDSYLDLIHFRGEVEDWGEEDGHPLRSYSNNRCVSGNFACGLDLVVPPAMESCLLASSNPLAPAGLRFLSSADCTELKQPGIANDYFVAVYRSQNWGFIEVAEAKDFSGILQVYEDVLVEGNKSNFEQWVSSIGTDELKFFSPGRNKTYRFTPEDEEFDRDCRACGSVINGDDDAFTITNPRMPGQGIRIDYSDAENPRREPLGDLQLANP